METGTDSISFNLSEKVDFADGVTAAFYKSDGDRENNRNPISGFDWYTQEVKAGNNRYYVRTSNANGDLKDYNINVCCVRTIKIDLLGFDRNEDAAIVIRLIPISCPLLTLWKAITLMLARYMICCRKERRYSEKTMCCTNSEKIIIIR